MANLSKGNSKSQLLSEDENQFLFNLFGKGCFTLATGVAQLFIVRSHRNKQRWEKQFCGVVCFVKDNPKKSYYIRLYDIQSQQLLWEQELYTKFIYNTPKQFFHTFEAHDCHAGLNFASEEEALHFGNVVEGKLLGKISKRKAREDKKAKKLPVTPETNKQTKETAKETADIPEKTTISQSSVILRNKKGKKKKKLTKDDVGGPLNFEHRSHMSWSVDGPHMDKLDETMRELLKEIGIEDRSQVDNETMDFICDFVHRNGGANAVKEDFAWHVPAEPSHPVIQSTANQRPFEEPNKVNIAPIKNRPLPALPETNEDSSSSTRKNMIATPIINPQDIANTSSLLRSISASTKSSKSTAANKFPPNNKPSQLISKQYPSPVIHPKPSSLGTSSNHEDQSTTNKSPKPFPATTHFASPEPHINLHSSTNPPHPPAHDPPYPLPKMPHPLTHSLPTPPLIKPHLPKPSPPTPPRVKPHPQTNHVPPPSPVKPISNAHSVPPTSPIILDTSQQLVPPQTQILLDTSKHFVPPSPRNLPDSSSHSFPPPPQILPDTPLASFPPPPQILPDTPSPSFPPPPQILPDTPLHSLSLPPQIFPDTPSPPQILPDKSLHSFPPPPPVLPDTCSHFMPQSPSPPILPDTCSHSVQEPPLPPPPPPLSQDASLHSKPLSPPDVQSQYHSLPPPPQNLTHYPTFTKATENVKLSEDESTTDLSNENQAFSRNDLQKEETDDHTSERDGLLSQIRRGTILKHVDIEKNPTSAKRGSIAAALMNQLMKRKTIVQFSDDEYSSDEFDDDWDDD